MSCPNGLLWWSKLRLHRNPQNPFSPVLAMRRIRRLSPPFQCPNLLVRCLKNPLKFPGLSSLLHLRPCNRHLRQVGLTWLALWMIYLVKMMDCRRSFPGVSPNPQRLSLMRSRTCPLSWNQPPRSRTFLQQSPLRMSLLLKRLRKNLVCKVASPMP